MITVGNYGCPNVSLNQVKKKEFQKIAEIMKFDLFYVGKGQGDAV